MRESASTIRDGPDLSLVMPCYNEEDVVARTLERLVASFREAGHDLEIIAVDNGSTDGTPEVLGRCEARLSEVRVVRVEENRGYGYGILSGLPHCRGGWAGIIPADGQVDADDVVLLYEEADASDGSVLAKVRRRFRMDGLRRKVVSLLYNLFFRVLWPGIHSLDVNGTPKICRLDLLRRMRLHSEGWLLDPEMVVKAHQMGLRILEFNVFGRLRSGGTSHVAPKALWEFFSSLLRFRFAPQTHLWKGESIDAKRTAHTNLQPQDDPPSAASR